MPSFSHLRSKFQKHADKTPPSYASSPGLPPVPNNLFQVVDYEVRDADSAVSTAAPREAKIVDIHELGNVASMSTLVKRDLGFQGKLGSYIVLTYGDTMFTDSAGSDEFRGMTCNSAAISCQDPTQVFDPVLDDNNYPRCLLLPSGEYGEDPSVYSLGITNVIETAHGEGVVYFLLNHRPQGKDHLLGAGVAEISIDSSHGHPILRTKRLGRYWWNGEKEPWYGDVCALKAGDYIYAYGHAKDNPWVYLTRVIHNQATKLDSYEYWNGNTWQHGKLMLEELNEKQSIFWQINQGQVIWSKYHQCFLFIFCDNFWSCQVLMRTSLVPEGPWSEAVTVYKPKPIQEGGNVYAAVPHPYFDPSGKTLVITYTNHPNTIQAIKVTFE